jgi:hypothetical protein
MIKGIDSIANYISLIETYIPKLGEGDLAEFGCFNGGHVARMSELVPTRKVWAFDTFEGMPDRDFNPEIDAENPPGKFTPEHDVLAYLAQFPNIQVCKGRYADTLSSIPAGTKFALVYLDCDYYLSHVQVFQYLKEHNHIYAGTIFVFDDYNHLEGARRAIDEFRGTTPLTHDNKILVYAPNQ